LTTWLAQQILSQIPDKTGFIGESTHEMVCSLQPNKYFEKITAGICVLRRLIHHEQG
jgi:hypothetical protein